MLSTDKNWWRQASIYQIYPRSFKDSNGDGLGDIKGITSKVDYLAGLSVDAVWLSPFFPSALADGGYDVDDYRDVDPKLGNLADFDEMVATLHARNIRVFVDIVPNHSSNLHKWFQEALAAPKGHPARDRYIFRDGSGLNGDLPPNNWPSHFAPNAWTRTKNSDGTPGQWYLHLFAPEQPDWNWDHLEVNEDFKKTLRFWSDRGVDGFRIDVAHAMKKDLSQPWREVKHMSAMELGMDGGHPLFDRNETHQVFREWRDVFNEYDPPRVAVAEAYVRAERRVLYARPDELGQAFNFDLLLAKFEALVFKKIITENIGLAKIEGSSSTWVLANHDQPRIPTKYGLPAGIDIKKWLLSDGKLAPLDKARGLAQARAAIMLIMALPGACYMYNGEELGLFEVEDLPHNAIQDPLFERNNRIEKGRDGCRVPLPWTKSGDSFGFGTNGAHLPQPAWFGEFSVEAQDGVEGSTLEMYRAAGVLRRKYQSTEEYAWIDTLDPEVLHFKRDNGWHSITNFAGKPFTLPAGEVLLTSGPLVDGRLGPNTTVWLRA